MNHTIISWPRWFGAPAMTKPARPLPEAMLARLSRRAGLESTPALRYIRSSVPNAAARLGPRGPEVLVSTALLDLLPDDELEAVLAHEVGHIRHGDLRRQAFLLFVGQALGIFGPVYGINALVLFLLGSGRFVESLGLSLLFSLLVQVFPWVVARLSRHQEFRADEVAAELTGRPLALARALERLHPRWATVRHPWFGTLWRVPLPQAPAGPLDSHPPVDHRIRRLAGLAGHGVRA